MDRLWKHNRCPLSREAARLRLQTGCSRDFLETVAAFRDKRKPTFEGDYCVSRRIINFISVSPVTMKRKRS